MAFIKTTRAREATGDVHDMYRRQQEHWGFVPNYAKVFSHRPEVMARWGRLLAEIRRPADDRRFELVTFAVARELKHSACSLAHGKKLAELIGADNVVAIAEGREPEVLSEAEIAMMRFARDVARDDRLHRGRHEPSLARPRASRAGRRAEPWRPRRPARAPARTRATARPGSSAMTPPLWSAAASS